MTEIMDKPNQRSGDSASLVVYLSLAL